MKKIISLLLSIVLIVTTCFSFSTIAFAEDGIKCGDNIIATFDAQTSTLYVKGFGDMYNYNAANMPAWTANIGSIKTIDVDYAIERIGSRAFYNCTNATKLIVRNINASFGDQYSAPENATIYGIDNSQAETFAIDNGFSFDFLYWVRFYDINNKNITEFNELYPNGTKAENVVAPDTHPAENNKDRQGWHYEYRWYLNKITLPAGIKDVTKDQNYYELKYSFPCVTADEAITQATCTTDGLNRCTCTVCGDQYEEVVKALGHNYEKSDEQTTDTEIIITYTCTRCNDTKTESIPIDKCAHKNRETLNKKNATCKDEGYSGDICCKDCGAIIVKGVTLPKTNIHDFGKDNTEETCKICGATNPDYVVQTCQHKNTTTKNEIKATCTTPGYSGDVYCNDCKKTIKRGEAVPKIDHDFGANNSEAVCKLCGAQNPNISQDCKHQNKETQNKKAPTCKDEGYTGDICCKDCGKVIIKGSAIPKTNNHDFGENKNENTCRICGAQNPNICKHTSTEIRNVPATCTEKGVDGAVFCKDCGIQITTGKSTNALGHHFGIYTSNNDANCAADGTKTAVCDRCGGTTTVVDPNTRLTAHSYVNGYCTVCGDKDKNYANGNNPTPPDNIFDDIFGSSKDNASQSTDKNNTTTAKDKNKDNNKNSSKKTAPKKTSITKIKKGKKSFKVYWKKISKVSGYQVQYSTSKKFTKSKTKTVTVKSAKSSNKAVKKLKGGKKYYVRVRTYKKTKVNGKVRTSYSSWSKAKTVVPKK